MRANAIHSPEAWQQKLRGLTTRQKFHTNRPLDWAPGGYLARVSSDDGVSWSTPFALNAPAPWFLFGDGGSTASPGGTVRVVGVNIQIHVTKVLLLPLIPITLLHICHPRRVILKRIVHSWNETLAGLPL